LVRVGPQAAATVTLAPGDYRVTQTALDGVPAATATTRFELQVTAGATYGWALATLLTGPDGAAP
jgi:hypothetical protein